MVASLASLIMSSSAFSCMNPIKGNSPSLGRDIGTYLKISALECVETTTC